MKYTGIPCAACGKKFTAEDDVVVCPECGTPYHRACYKELGHCVNEARHAEGYVWQPPKAAPGPSVPLEEQPHAPQNKTDGEGYVMCSRCGTVNPAGQERCDLCGYPLKETGDRIPAGDRETEDGGTFADYVRDQSNVKFMHINTLSPYYQALVSTSAIVQYGGLVLSVLCSLFFNYFYLKKITQQVRIQRYRGHAAAGTQQYYQNLSRMGGTSWLLVFLIVIGLLSVSSVVTSLFVI